MKTKNPNGAGSVYFHPATNRWVATGYLLDEFGNKKRRVFYGKTESEARHKWEDAKVANRRGDFSMFKAGTTVGQWCEYWLSTVTGIRPTTKANYEKAIRLHIIPSLGSINLISLMPSRVNQWLRECQEKKGLSAGTVQTYKTVLSMALKAAIVDGLIVRNAASQSRSVNRSERRYQVWTPADLAKLYTANPGHQDLPLWKVLAETGLRIGEAQGLKWNDINFSEKTITVGRSAGYTKGTWTIAAPKTARSKRTFKVSSRVMDAFADQLAMQRTGVEQFQGHIFVSEDGIPSLPIPTLQRFQRALKRANLPVGRLHDLRHSYASLLLHQGVPLPTVSQLLGHANTEITARVYAHELEVLSTAGVDALDRAYSE